MRRANEFLADPRSTDHAGRLLDIMSAYEEAQMSKRMHDPLVILALVRNHTSVRFDMRKSKVRLCNGNSMGWFGVQPRTLPIVNISVTVWNVTSHRASPLAEQLWRCSFARDLCACVRRPVYSYHLVLLFAGQSQVVVFFNTGVQLS
jgi:hypothetical protein